MNKRHYEHTLPNIRGSLSNTYFICRICFISRYCMPVESEYQAAEDAEKYRRRYQKAGDFIEEPEESPETDDGDCRPYR